MHLEKFKNTHIGPRRIFKSFCVQSCVPGTLWFNSINHFIQNMEKNVPEEIAIQFQNNNILCWIMH